MHRQRADMTLDKHAIHGAGKGFAVVRTAKDALADGADVKPMGRKHGWTFSCYRDGNEYGLDCMPLPAEREILLGRPERLFYDGTCGLCHAAVRFVLAEDHTGNTFRFAPLDSDIFRSAIPEAERASLGETLVVQTADGAVLARSRAILHIMRRLGGIWRLLAGVLAIIPRPFLDCLYNSVDWCRHRMLRRSEEVCNYCPPGLRHLSHCV